MALDRWAKTIFITDIYGNELEITAYNDAIIFKDKFSGRVFNIDESDYDLFIDLISQQNG